MLESLPSSLLWAVASFLQVEVVLLDIRLVCRACKKCATTHVSDEKVEQVDRLLCEVDVCRISSLRLQKFSPLAEALLRRNRTHIESLSLRHLSYSPLLFRLDLTDFVSLATLQLMFVNQKQLHAISQLSQLTCLWIERCLAQQLEPLRGLARLAELVLYYPFATGIEVVFTLHTVESLRIELLSGSVRDPKYVVSELSAMPRLKRFVYEGPVALGGSNTLEVCDVANVFPTSPWQPPLREFKCHSNLGHYVDFLPQSLECLVCQLACSRDVRVLARRCPRLRDLSLGGRIRKLSDFNQFPHLRQLELCSTRNLDLRQVSGELEILRLTTTPGFLLLHVDSLLRLTSLRELELPGNGFVAQFLTRLPYLHTLVVINSSATIHVDGWSVREVDAHLRFERQEICMAHANQ